MPKYQPTNGRNLREERGQLVKDLESLTDQVELRKISRGEYSRKFAELESQIQLLDERITAADAGGWKDQRDINYSHAPPHDAIGSLGEQRIVSPTRRENPEHRAAFDAYLRMGPSKMSPDQYSLLQREFRDMGSGGQGAYPGATTGFFVPVGFVDKILEAMRYFGPMLEEANTFDTATGQILPFPTANDTTVMGELVGEGQQVTSVDVAIGQIMFSAYKFSSRLVKCSIELLQDSAFDLDSWLAKELGIRIGRIINNMTTLGTGVAQPRGLLPSVIAGGNLIQAVGSLANDGVGGPGSVGSDDLTNLEHQIDPLYRQGAKYMMHDSVLRQLKNLKDKYGRPLWNDASVVTGQPAQLNGYPYAINNDMAPITKNSPGLLQTPILFGNFKTLFGIRRVKEMSLLRLEERFADYGQVAFLGFWRGDSQSLDQAHNGVAGLQVTY